MSQLQNTTLSKVQEAKLREEAAQLISRWKEEKINYFGSVNREVMEKKKKKTGFATSKKTKEPSYFLTVVVLGGYRMWLIPVQQDTTAKQTILENVELHYLDINSITYDEPSGKIELALNPDAKGKGDTEAYTLYATNSKEIVTQIQFCYHDIAGASPLPIIGKQIPVQNPFFPRLLNFFVPQNV